MLEVRDAVGADAMGVAEVHIRSWQQGYRGLLPDSYLDGLRPEERAAQYSFDDASGTVPQTLVAVLDGAIRGFAAVGLAREGDTVGLGELFALYVDPGYWRLGVGRLLIGHARRRLASRGSTEAVLWLLVGNERAAAFYAADGWATDGVARKDEVWGVTVDELRHRRALP